MSVSTSALRPPTSVDYVELGYCDSDALISSAMRVCEGSTAAGPTSARSCGRRDYRDRDRYHVAARDRGEFAFLRRLRVGGVGDARVRRGLLVFLPRLVTSAVPMSLRPSRRDIEVAEESVETDSVPCFLCSGRCCVCFCVCRLD